MLLGALLLVGTMLPGLARLQVNTDGGMLVPQDAAGVVRDREWRQAFGLNDQAVVLVETGEPQGIYSVDALRAVRDITQRIQDLDGIGPLNVASLSTELSDRFQTGTLMFHALLTPFPESAADCERVRDDVEANGLYVGNLVSFDGSAAAILFGTPADTDRVALSHQVWRILEDFDDAAVSVYALGAPFAEALLGNHILEDLGIPEDLLGHTPASDRSVVATSGVYALRTWIGENIGLLPIAILIMALVFWIGFGQPLCMLLPLLQVGACLAFTFGAMGYVGVPIYLTIAVLPIILTCIGVADEVHILGRYLQHGRRHAAATRVALVQRTLEDMRPPVVRTSLTTAVGFLSFAIAPIEPVRMFGLFAALGILFCMAWSLTATPALLCLLPRRWLQSQRSWVAAAGDGGRGGLPGRLWNLSHRHPRAVLIVALLLSLAAGNGIRQLQVQDSWIDGFDPQSAFYQATQHFNDGFFGPHILQIGIDTGRRSLQDIVNISNVHDNVYRIAASFDGSPEELAGAALRVQHVDSTWVQQWDRTGGKSNPVWEAFLDSVQVQEDSLILFAQQRAGSATFLLRLQGDEDLRVEVVTRRFDDHDTLDRLAQLGAFIRSRQDLAVGGVLGPADYLSTTWYIYHRRNEEKRTIPPTTTRIAAQWGHFGRVRGEHYVHRVVDDTHSRGILSVYLKNANYRDTRQLLDDIREYEARHLTPVGITLSFAGDVAVSQTLIGAIVETQVGSLLLSLVGIFLVSMLLQRSWRLGLLTLLPVGFAILLNFGFMGWTGMPLGVATSMFAGMILGIGVDFAIHLLDRYRRHRQAGHDRTAALAEAVTVAGRPILLDSLAVALGFGVLMLSRVPANARLGALALLAVLSCVAATLLLLPSLLQTERDDASRP